MHPITDQEIITKMIHTLFGMKIGIQVTITTFGDEKMIVQIIDGEQI